MANKETRLLLDGNMLAWANSCSLRQLSTSDGRQSGAFFGFMRQLRSFVTTLKATSVAVAWDTGKTWRHEVSAAYKGDRVPGSDGFYAQVSDIKAALSCINVHQMQAPGFEADDIASFCVKGLVENEHLTLVTTDRDWFQLIRPTVDVYEPKLKKLVTAKNFKDFTGYATPEQFIISKVILGDTSDNIDGLEGVGPVKLKSYFEDPAKDPNNTKKIEEYLASEDGKNAMALVQLLEPVAGVEDIQVEVAALRDGWPELVNKYECKSLLKPDWLAPFAGLTA